MKTYGYLTSNSTGQGRNQELEALVNYGCDEIIIASEEKSLETNPSWLVQSLKSGDNLVVYDLFSLCQTSSELINFLKELTKRGITLKSLTDGFSAELILDDNVFQLLSLVTRLARVEFEKEI